MSENVQDFAASEIDSIVERLHLNGGMPFTTYEITAAEALRIGLFNQARHAQHRLLCDREVAIKALHGFLVLLQLRPRQRHSRRRERFRRRHDGRLPAGPL